MSEWLELELAHRLAPVRAPEQLWHLLQTPGPSGNARRRPVKTVLLLAAAAAASVWVAAAWRPEARNAQTIILSANPAESHIACRACHAD
jgi:ferric-dicitrate binding protein FerR (iron transport regulator)